MNLLARSVMRSNVEKLDDGTLVAEYEMAQGMESGDAEDPSRVWTRMLAHEINVRGLEF